MEYRERALSLRDRYVLIPQLGETVIGGDEQVVSGYGRARIIGQPLAGNALGILVPDCLNLLGLTPPGFQGTVMERPLIQLAVSTWEHRRGLLAVVALAVPVIEGLIAEGSPAIAYENIRIKTWHSGKRCYGRSRSPVYKS